VAAAQAAGQLRTIGWADAGDGTLQVAFAAPGDTNLDGLLDVLDAANILAGGLFDSGAQAIWTQGDFNYDAVLDILDAADFLSTGLFDQGPYEASAAAAVAAVPEPAAGPLLVVAVAALGAAGGRRRRRC
jgi:hypothetical protein